MRRVLRPGLSIVVAVALSTLLTAPAMARAPEPAASVSPLVQSSGECSGPSTWLLVARHADGAIRVRFAVQGGAAHQKWNVFLSDDGNGFFAGSRMSHKGGKIVVTVSTPDLDGKDKIRAGASNVPTGETCNGQVAV